MKNIGKDVNSRGNVGVKGFGVVDGVFSLLKCEQRLSLGIDSTNGCVGVEVSTHVLDFELQLLLRSLLGALSIVLASIATASCTSIYLESEMLQEVRSSIGLIRLSARSSIYPDTDGGRLCPR